MPPNGNNGHCVPDSGFYLVQTSLVDASTVSVSASTICGNWLQCPISLAHT